MCEVAGLLILFAVFSSRKVATKSLAKAKSFLFASNLWCKRFLFLVGALKIDAPLVAWLPLQETFFRISFRWYNISHFFLLEIVATFTCSFCTYFFFYKGYQHPNITKAVPFSRPEPRSSNRNGKRLDSSSDIAVRSL